MDPETYTLTRVTDPTGQAVNYTYDAAHRVTQVESVAGGKTYKNTYTYENDRSGMLKEVRYGNGGKVGDEYDRLTDAKYPDKTIPRNSRKNNPDVYNIIEVDIE